MRLMMIIVGLLMFGLLIMGYNFEINKTREIIEIKITDKGIVIEQEKSKYLIYTQNEVFENVDDLLRGKYNSSDIQGGLIKDSTYTVEVVGYRNQRFSMCRNIL